LFRKILTGSGLYSIALAGSVLASVVLLPINSRFLEKADFGVLELLERVTTIVSMMLGVNLSAAFGFFYFQPPPEQRPTVIGTMFAGSVLTGLVAGGIGFFLAPQLSLWIFTSSVYTPYLHVTFASLIFGFLLEAGMSWLRVEDRASVYVAASFWRIGIVLTLTVLGVAVFHLRIWGVLLANVTAIVLLSIAIAVYCFRTYRFSFDPRLFIKVMRFSLPLSLSALAMFVIHFGDRFIIPHYRTFGDLGLYSIAYKIGMLLSVVQIAFQNYWGAQVYQIAKRDDAHSIIARVFSYLMLIMVFCSLGLVIAAKPALHLLPRSYWEASALVPIIVLSYLLRSVGDYFRYLFLVEGLATYEAACSWIGAATCLAAYFILIPRFGIWGAAEATLITFFVLAIVAMVWTYRIHPWWVESGRLFKIAGAASLPLAAYFLVPVSNLAAQIGWAVLLLAAYPLLLILLRFPTPAERELLASLPDRARTFLAN